MVRPQPGEYPSYYSRYIDRVPDKPILEVLAAQGKEGFRFFNTFSEEVAGYRYAADKWSIKEVIGHVIDVERIFVYRALRFARNDPTPLAEFDQELYVHNGDFEQRSIIELNDDFRLTREFTVRFFTTMNDEMWTREGTASGYRFTVRAIPYILAGHEQHHRQIIKERYF